SGAEDKHMARMSKRGAISREDSIQEEARSQPLGKPLVLSNGTALADHAQSHRSGRWSPPCGANEDTTRPARGPTQRATRRRRFHGSGVARAAGQWAACQLQPRQPGTGAGLDARALAAARAAARRRDMIESTS